MKEVSNKEKKFPPNEMAGTEEMERVGAKT